MEQPIAKKIVAANDLQEQVRQGKITFHEAHNIMMEKEREAIEENTSRNAMKYTTMDPFADDVEVENVGQSTSHLDPVMEFVRVDYDNVIGERDPKNG